MDFPNSTGLEREQNKRPSISVFSEKNFLMQILYTELKMLWTKYFDDKTPCSFSEQHIELSDHWSLFQSRLHSQLLEWTEFQCSLKNFKKKSFKFLKQTLTHFKTGRISGKSLQRTAKSSLHILVQQSWGWPKPAWLLPASLSWLAQAGGAGGSTDCPVIHLKQYKGRTQMHYHFKSLQFNTHACCVFRLLYIWFPSSILTRLTAKVAIPNMAAPPTPSTSRAFDSTKSMAVPMPLSSFFPLRSPALAIAPLWEEENIQNC